MSLSTFCITYITIGRFKGRGNSVHIRWVRFVTVNCRTSESNYQLSLRVQGLNCRSQKWKASVLPTISPPHVYMGLKYSLAKVFKSRMGI